MGRRLPNSVHEASTWVINQIAPDFTLLDVWALPAVGERGEFDELLEVMTAFDPARMGNLPSRFLFAVRLKLGERFGWDGAADPLSIPGCQESSLVDRLPEDLRGSAEASEISTAMQRVAGGFVPVYRTEDEWAAEISNATVHGVLHLAWVERRMRRTAGGSRST